MIHLSDVAMIVLCKGNMLMKYVNPPGASPYKAMFHKCSILKYS